MKKVTLIRKDDTLYVIGDNDITEHTVGHAGYGIPLDAQDEICDHLGIDSSMGVLSNEFTEEELNEPTEEELLDEVYNPGNVPKSSVGHSIKNLSRNKR